MNISFLVISSVPSRKVSLTEDAQYPNQKSPKQTAIIDYLGAQLMAAFMDWTELDIKVARKYFTHRPYHRNLRIAGTRKMTQFHAKNKEQ